MLKIDEVDEHLRFNAFVLSGYRSRLKHNQCLLSIFQLHNETGIALSLTIQVTLALV
jgi:hypothetical protein